VIELPVFVNDALQSVIDSGRPWLSQYGLWAVSIGVFTETLLFTGVVVPGMAILVCAGYLIGAGVFSAPVVFVVAWVAAALGDQASYLLSRSVGTILLRRNADRATRLRRRLDRDGALLLLTYHYSPILRAILPCVAGTASYPRRKWLILDTIGVGIWVATLLLLGFSAYGALQKGTGVAFHAINLLTTILTVFICWRFSRRLEPTVALGDD
jgi:membrane protein DedA with SNARE-associated domain